MKGVSTIIVIILILMITVALSALSYMFFSRIFTSITTAGKEAIGQATTTTTSLMKIEATTGSDIYIRNIGGSDLTNFSIYLNDKQVNYVATPSTIKPGEVSKITVMNFIPPGNNEVKITSATGSFVTTKNVNPSTDSSLVLWVTFDDCTAKDYSKYGNNGNPLNGPACVNGKYGKALNFSSGSSQYVSISNSPSLTYFDQQTLMAWINITTLKTSAGIISKWTRYNFLLAEYWANSNITYFIGNGTDVAVGVMNSTSDYLPTLTINQWYHFAAVFNGTHIKVFRNGVLSSAEKIPLYNGLLINIGDSTVPTLLGTYSTAYFDGVIDEVRIYNRALSPEEIYAYANTNP